MTLLKKTRIYSVRGGKFTVILIAIVLLASLINCESYDDYDDEQHESSDNFATASDEDYGTESDLNLTESANFNHLSEPDLFDKQEELSPKNIFLEASKLYSSASKELVERFFPTVVKSAYGFIDSVDPKCMSSLMAWFYAIRDQKTWALRGE